MSIFQGHCFADRQNGPSFRRLGRSEAAASAVIVAVASLPAIRFYTETLLDPPSYAGRVTASQADLRVHRTMSCPVTSRECDMNRRLQVIDRYHAIWRPILGAVIVFCALSRTVEAQYRALAVFDDGTGPALYAGGVVAKWDGSTWTALSTGLGDVYALTVFDDGTGPALYVGGRFYIRKWDGANWTAVGGLSSGIIVDLDGPGRNPRGRLCALGL
jgi:hypothetical protein